MNKQEIENTQEAIKLLTDIRNSVTTDRFMDFLDTQLLDLQAQLAESDEKPKPLEHGVCAVSSVGEPFVVIEQTTLSGSPKAFYGDQGGTINADKAIKDFTILIPNIFDDLAALKPIKEFEMKDCTGGNDFEARIDCNGHVELRAGRGLVTVNDREFHEIIINLRCLELQMIQDAAKQ